MPRRKLMISFGMVTIPVFLEKAIQKHDISFNLLCKDSFERVKYKKVCPNSEKEISSDDLIKGYKYSEDEYIVLTNEELENLKTKKDKMINIIAFTKPEKIDSIYFDEPYLLLPQDIGKKAFDLLYLSMQEMKLWAVAKSVLSSREVLMVLKASPTGIVMNTLHYQDEVVHSTLFKANKVDKEELTMAKTFVKYLQKDFDIKDFKDEYKSRLEKAIEDKIAGKKITKAKEKEKAATKNLMAALEKSIDSIRNTGRA